MKKIEYKIELNSKKTLKSLQVWVMLKHCGAHTVKAQTDSLASWYSLYSQLLSLDLEACNWYSNIAIKSNRIEIQQMHQ